MMTGCIEGRSPARRPQPRLYVVIARAGGWSIALNGACTRPLATRSAAERIARLLQKQANALRGPKTSRDH